MPGDPFEGPVMPLNAYETKQSVVSGSLMPIHSDDVERRAAQGPQGGDHRRQEFPRYSEAFKIKGRQGRKRLAFVYPFKSIDDALVEDA